MLRVLLDANIFVSYLLAPDAGANTIATLVSDGFLQDYQLLTAHVILDEVTRVIRSKPYLQQRIEPVDLEQTLALILNVGEIIPNILSPIPAVTRDRKDDYLIAYALVSQADYLVSGDQDLLVLDPLGALRIVTPREMLAILARDD